MVVRLHRLPRWECAGSLLAMFCCGAVLLLAVLSAQIATAQIYEWRDAAGSRHFTTDLEDLPADQRLPPRIFVRESAWRSAAATEAVRQDRRREAQVVYDHSRRRRAFEPEAAQGGERQIDGPLAIVRVEVPQVPAFGCSPPFGFSPLVTTSFDGGRSRHQTLRMLLQDRFQLDRDGSFPDYVGRVGSVSRPRLLPPHGLVYGSWRGGRVVHR